MQRRATYTENEATQAILASLQALMGFDRVRPILSPSLEFDIDLHETPSAEFSPCLPIICVNAISRTGISTRKFRFSESTNHASLNYNPR